MKGDEGAHFLADFEALKSATGDSPDNLEAMWPDREDITRLCDRLSDYHRSFEVAEEWTSIAFTPHVPAAASRARRDFDERWLRIVSRIANRKLLAFFDSIIPDLIDGEPAASDSLANDIEGWKQGAGGDARILQHAFSYLADKRANDEFGDFEWVDDAERSWDRLRYVVGLDLQGVFWRRSAIPHILFPSHVSNRYGKQRASIYRRLQNAARSFVFDAPLASLAMQRAVLEELLKEHWGASRGVQDAKLPTLLHDRRAARLKRLANEALHGDPEDLSSDELEHEIIKNFLLLRELIEATPGG